MRAARVRAKLTQEQVAEQLNVSINTYRRWDRGRNRPAQLEQMQLLAAVLGTSIEVIWPPEHNPRIDRDLGDDEARTVPAGHDDEARSTPTAPALDPAGSLTGDAEIRARRPDETHPAPSTESEQAHVASRVGGRPATDGFAGSDPNRRVTDAGRRPLWPGDRLDDVPCAARPAGANAEAWRGDTPAFDGQDAAPAAPVTLSAMRAPSSRVVKRVAVALAAALMLGGAGVIAASALRERAADNLDHSAQVAAEQRAASERQRVEARRRDASAMAAAANRRDYDAAINVARRIGDPAAVARYRASGARVLVGRAAKAARRGDLPLARSRLKRAKTRYGSAPGAQAVRARIQRVERQRAARARQRRAESRRAAAAAAAQPAPSVRSTPTVTESSPAPSPRPQPSTSAPEPSSSSSSSSKKGSNGSGSEDREKTVDPGLF